MRSREPAAANSSRGPATIDEYLAPLSEEKRAALQKLRKAIRSAAPAAEECVSYGIPGFRLDGKLLVSFGTAAKHCAFHTGAHPLAAHRKELSAYDLTKGALRFPPAAPLPAALVRKLVKTRIAEHAARKSRGGAMAERPRSSARPGSAGSARRRR